MYDNEVTGTVDDYDDHVGAGSLTTAEGRHLPFHCTQIADGTRSIKPGTAVRFQVRGVLPGRWEAVALRPLA